MRSYTVATAAVTLQVTPKWLDNTLSHHRVEGVVRSRQGVSRRLTPKAVLTLHVALSLASALTMPFGKALDLADRLSRANGSGRASLTPHVAVEIEIEAMTEEVSSRLAAAVEVTPVPQRGRPRTR